MWWINYINRWTPLDLYALRPISYKYQVKTRNKLPIFLFFFCAIIFLLTFFQQCVPPMEIQIPPSINPADQLKTTTTPTATPSPTLTTPTATPTLTPTPTVTITPTTTQKPADNSKNTFQQVYSGKHHSCAITVGKQVYCWGINSGWIWDFQYSRLGDGSALDSAKPVLVPLPQGTSIQKLALSENSTCGISDLGQLFCWGAIANSPIMAPVAIPTPSRVFDIALTKTNACMITEDNNIYCWPIGSYQPCNKNGYKYNTDYFEECNPITNALSRFCWIGGKSRFALDQFQRKQTTCQKISNESEYNCWQLGAIKTPNKLSIPNDGITSVIPVLISAGDYHFCLASKSNQLFCWGFNEDWTASDWWTVQRMDFDAVAEANSTTSLSNLTEDILQITSYKQKTCYLDNQSVLFCIEFLPKAQDGQKFRLTEEKIENSKKLVLGEDFRCVLKIDSYIYCAGNRSSTPLSSFTPVKTQDGTANFIAHDFSGYDNRMLALDSQFYPFTWGLTILPRENHQMQQPSKVPLPSGEKWTDVFTSHSESVLCGSLSQANGTDIFRCTGDLGGSLLDFNIPSSMKPPLRFHFGKLILELKHTTIAPSFYLGDSQDTFFVSGIKDPNPFSCKSQGTCAYYNQCLLNFDPEPNLFYQHLCPDPLRSTCLGRLWEMSWSDSSANALFTQRPQRNADEIVYTFAPPKTLIMARRNYSGTQEGNPQLPANWIYDTYKLELPQEPPEAPKPIQFAVNQQRTCILLKSATGTTDLYCFFATTSAIDMVKTTDVYMALANVENFSLSSDDVLCTWKTATPGLNCYTFNVDRSLSPTPSLLNSLLEDSALKIKSLVQARAYPGTFRCAVVEMSDHAEKLYCVLFEKNSTQYNRVEWTLPQTTSANSAYALKKLSLGYGFGALLTNAGELYTWGHNVNNILGLPAQVSFDLLPQPLDLANWNPKMGGVQ